MKTLVLITARAGSKRVPGKNVRLLNGYPLINYTFTHALAIKEKCEIFLSTDDVKASEIAKIRNINVIKRPSDLATDSSSTIDVVKHALTYLKDAGLSFNHVLLLQPTVPIRSISKIHEAMKIAIETNCDSVSSHILVDFYHPNRLKCVIDSRVKNYSETEIENISRSQLPKVYYRDGSIYLFRNELPFDSNSLLGQDQRAVILNEEYFVNIDSERDWLLAEALIKKYPTGIVD